MSGENHHSNSDPVLSLSGHSRPQGLYYGIREKGVEIQLDWGVKKGSKNVIKLGEKYKGRKID